MPSLPPERGESFNLGCWNGLSHQQQRRLIEVGNLEFGYKMEGLCKNGAEIAIETAYDEAPGPRFYCHACAITYLTMGVRR